MNAIYKVQNYLTKSKPAVFIFFCSSAAFLTYCSMYAFRKPFTAGTYQGLSLFGVDYKVALIILQLIGYALSKFIGIKLIAELTPQKRVQTLIVLMGLAFLSLLGFGLVPYPYNAVFMLLNGLPLGLIWGVVFSFLEGRKFTEILGAFMASSFMIASGIVKSIGLFLIQQFSVSEQWMPFFAALVFIPILMVGIWMLSCIPEPNQEDISLRTERVPMDAANRIKFFKLFWPGIFLVVAIYVGLTVFRDLRDNFAVELWTELGYLKTPWVLVFAEIPIAIIVLGMITSKLMPHFMRNIVNVKRITNRRTTARYTTRFLSSSAHNTKTSQPPTVRSKDMTNIVIRTPNNRIRVGLVLINHSSRSTICIWIGCGRSINQRIIIWDNHHGDGYIFLVHPIHTIHSNYLSGGR